MSKEISVERMHDAMHRLRTYRTYVRTQPQTGWGRTETRNGKLQLTAVAGAGL